MNAATSHVRTRSLLALATAIVTSVLAIPADAETAGAAALVRALRQGGYVIVMRHPSSPSTLPDKQHADPGNTTLERQLDTTGRTSAQAMGDAFRRLRIPVGEILSSPAFRAREAVRLARFGKPRTVEELDDGGQTMTAGADAERSAWLRSRVAEAPRPGVNTIIVTHAPNLTGAFGASAAGMAAGEALIVHPNGTATPDLAGRVRIEEWPTFADSR